MQKYKNTLHCTPLLHVCSMYKSINFLHQVRNWYQVCVLGRFYINFLHQVRNWYQLRILGRFLYQFPTSVSHLVSVSHFGPFLYQFPTSVTTTGSKCITGIGNGPKCVNGPKTRRCLETAQNAQVGNGPKPVTRQKRPKTRNWETAQNRQLTQKRPKTRNGPKLFFSENKKRVLPGTHNECLYLLDRSSSGVRQSEPSSWGERKWSGHKTDRTHLPKCDSVYTSFVLDGRVRPK